MLHLTWAFWCLQTGRSFCTGSASTCQEHIETWLLMMLLSLLLLSLLEALLPWLGGTTSNRCSRKDSCIGFLANPQWSSTLQRTRPLLVRKTGPMRERPWDAKWPLCSLRMQMEAWSDVSTERALVCSRNSSALLSSSRPLEELLCLQILRGQQQTQSSTWSPTTRTSRSCDLHAPWNLLQLRCTCIPWTTK